MSQLHGIEAEGLAAAYKGSGSFVKGSGSCRTQWCNRSLIFFANLKEPLKITNNVFYRFFISSFIQEIFQLNFEDYACLHHKWDHVTLGCLQAMIRTNQKLVSICYLISHIE